MQVSFKQSPQAARATTKSSDVTRMIYASRAVPMAARNAVVGLIEVADGRSRSALYSGLNRRLERVNYKDDSQARAADYTLVKNLICIYFLRGSDASFWNT